MLNLTYTADNDGPAEDDGMTLPELESYLAHARDAGAGDTSVVTVQANRFRRIRVLTVEAVPDAGHDTARDEAADDPS